MERTLNIQWKGKKKKTDLKTGERFEQILHHREVWMEARHMKRCSISYLLREIFKTCAVPAHLLEWLNKICWQYKVLTRIQRNWSFHTLLVGIQSSTASLENRSYRVKHILILWFSNPTPNCNHPKQEATPKPFNRWMDKQWPIHTMECCSVIKIRTKKCGYRQQTGWILKMSEWKKLISESCTLWFHLHEIYCEGSVT